MTTPDRFLNWRLGTERVWPVTVRRTPQGAAARGNRAQPVTMRRWVTLRARAALQATSVDAEYEIEFRRGSDRRAVDLSLETAPAPFLVRLEWTDEGSDAAEGELVLARCGLPLRLDGGLEIEIDDEALARTGLRSRDELARRLVLSTPEGGLVVVRTQPLHGAERIFDDATPQAPVGVFADNGKSLECDVEGVPGHEHLVVRDVRDATLRQNAVRFARIADAPRVVPPGRARGTDLAALAPIEHPRLRAWLEYEHRDVLRAKERLALRVDHPLEYAECRAVEGGDQPVFPAVLAAANEEALAGWIDPRALGRRQKDSIEVEVRALDGSAPIPGSVVGFERSQDGRVVARVRLLRAADVLPARGRIIARENRSDDAQRRRRRAALSRILFGGAASPSLLSTLLDPDKVTPARASARYRAREGAPVLNPAQEQAVARALAGLGIVLIQGPPGTGKTQVITEIILQWRARQRRARPDGAPSAPLRVLVSSVQNDAVENAVARLRGEGVQVRHLVSASRRTEPVVTRGETTAAMLRGRLMADPDFVHRVRVVKLRDLLAALSDAVDSAGDDAALADALAAFSRHPEVAELTATLARDLADVRERSPATPAVPAPDARGEAGASPREALARVPATLDLAPDTLHAVAKVVVALRAREETFVEAERWERLRRRLEYDVTNGRLREETATAWERAWAVVERPPPPERPRLDGRWRGDLAAWVRRASASVDALCEASDRTDAAVLDEWVCTLEEEPGRYDELERTHAPVVAATCQLAAPRDDEEDLEPYDLVIVDEAARAGIDVLIPMSLGREVVLVGDHLQLPPHVEDEIARELEQDLIEKAPPQESLFLWLWERLPETHKIALECQYRMHVDIGTVVSSAFYEPGLQLQHAFIGARAAERAPRFGLFDDTPLVWVESGPAWRHGPEAREINEREVDLARRILSLAARDELERLRDGGRRPKVIGLIPFYGEQRTRMEAMLCGLPAWLQEMVRCGTVDQFQGMEFPLVILSCVRSNPRRAIGFLSLPQRVNVAISRGQRQVIILGDGETLARERNEDAPLGRVHALIRGGRGRVVRAEEVTG